MTPSLRISATELGRVRGHPALPEAVAQSATWLIRTYSGNRLPNMLLCDRGRVLVGLLVSYLDVLPMPGTNSVAATVGSVQKLCRHTGLCSAGRAASVLAAMRFGGYIVSTGDPDDRRRRVLRPTAKLTGMQMDNWSRQFEAMASILPDAASIPSALCRPAFRTGFLHALGSHFIGGLRLLDHVPVLASLVESNAGLLVLVSLALPELNGEAAPEEPVSLSISALSRRFCISRAHVRKLLHGAQTAGLLASGPHPETVVVLPSLMDAILCFYAALFALFHRCAVLAARDEARSQDGAIQPISASDVPSDAAVWPETSRGVDRMSSYRIKVAATGVALLLSTAAASAQAPSAAQRDAIRQSCAADYQASCAGVPTGGRPALECLQQHMSSLAPACRSAVSAVTPGAAVNRQAPASSEPGGAAPGAAIGGAAPGAAMGGGNPGQACRGDMRSFCSGVRLGAGRALMCLREHAAELSPRCQAALARLRR